MYLVDKELLNIQKEIGPEHIDITGNRMLWKEEEDNQPFSHQGTVNRLTYTTNVFTDNEHLFIFSKELLKEAEDNKDIEEHKKYKYVLEKYSYIQNKWCYKGHVLVVQKDG